MVYCGGRFGPLSVNKTFPFMRSTMTFKRIEFGFRIEQDTNESFFLHEKLKQTDPKYKYYDENSKTEWRTFCACKDGEAVMSETQVSKIIKTIFIENSAKYQHIKNSNKFNKYFRDFGQFLEELI